MRVLGDPLSRVDQDRTAVAGHATATMTLDNYGHLYPDELDEVARQIGAQCVYQVRTVASQLADPRSVRSRQILKPPHRALTCSVDNALDPYRSLANLWATSPVSA